MVGERRSEVGRVETSSSSKAASTATSEAASTSKSVTAKSATTESATTKASCTLRVSNGESAKRCEAHLPEKRQRSFPSFPSLPISSRRARR
jgi:hypothetical protein